MPHDRTTTTRNTYLTHGEDLFTCKGPEGTLECSLLSVPKPQGICLLCHPHPLFSGNMFHKVITTGVQACRLAGWNAVRFNFRQVGLSEGVHDHGLGETQDLFAVATWARQRFPTLPVVGFGFSFGAKVLIDSLPTLNLQRALLVAPPIERMAISLDKLSHTTIPLHVLLAEEDELFALPKQREFWMRHAPCATVSVIPKAGHFFHGALATLRSHIVNLLSRSD